MIKTKWVTDKTYKDKKWLVVNKIPMGYVFHGDWDNQWIAASLYYNKTKLAGFEKKKYAKKFLKDHILNNQLRIVNMDIIT